MHWRISGLSSVPRPLENKRALHVSCSIFWSSYDLLEWILAYLYHFTHQHLNFSLSLPLSLTIPTNPSYWYKSLHVLQVSWKFVLHSIWLNTVRVGIHNTCDFTVMTDCVGMKMCYLSLVVFTWYINGFRMWKRLFSLSLSHYCVPISLFLSFVLSLSLSLSPSLSVSANK